MYNILTKIYEADSHRINYYRLLKHIIGRDISKWIGNQKKLFVIFSCHWVVLFAIGFNFNKSEHGFYWFN